MKKTAGATFQSEEVKDNQLHPRKIFREWKGGETLEKGKRLKDRRFHGRSAFKKGGN